MINEKYKNNIGIVKTISDLVAYFLFKLIQSKGNSSARANN